MTHRSRGVRAVGVGVGVSIAPSSSLASLLETLREISTISNSTSSRDRDMNEMIQMKQNSLQTCIKSIQNEIIKNDDSSNEITETSSNSANVSASSNSSNNTENNNANYKHIMVPLSAIANASAILKYYSHDTDSNNNTDSVAIHQRAHVRELKQKLEQNLKQNTKLYFSSTTNNNTNNSTSTSSSGSGMSIYTSNQNQETEYQKRIELLKLKIEERKYSKLTSNLDVTPKDDATLSSMLYASSVGMNMIVAPISIGVLMYFFADKLSSWILVDNDGNNNNNNFNKKNGQLNIHGVIVGVISGVIMLFIEMILFVIRNHEMDKHMSEKKKKSKKNPFGYDVKTAKRTFHG